MTTLLDLLFSCLAFFFFLMPIFTGSSLIPQIPYSNIPRESYGKLGLEFARNREAYTVMVCKHTGIFLKGCAGQ